MLFIKNIRIKVKFIAFAFFSLAINLVFSQNKKEQIEALNFRLDSLHNILTISKISFSDSLFTERFNSKQQRILIEQQKTEMELQMLQAKNLNSQIIALNTEVSELKNKIEVLKNNQEVFFNTQIQHFTLFKDCSYIYDDEFYESMLGITTTTI